MWGAIMNLKRRDVIFIMASLIIFIAPSAVSFVWGSGNYTTDFIFIFGLASFFFFISLMGIIFPKKHMGFYEIRKYNIILVGLL